MKTLICFNDFENPIMFTIVPGDLSKFNGICINSGYATINSGDANEFDKEFIEWMWDSEGKPNLENKWTTDVSLVESKDWDKFVICSFLP